jgi:hypothetical protein
MEICELEIPVNPPSLPFGVLDLNITNWKIDCQHAIASRSRRAINYRTDSKSQLILSDYLSFNSKLYFAFLA